MKVKEDFSMEWIYETGIEIPEILGSGSNFSSVVTTTDMNKAFAEFKEKGRNYLIRYKKEKGRKVNMQEYCAGNNSWINI